MITRSHRFHGYGSLRSVYRRGQTTRSQQLSLKFAARNPQLPYRMAVVVSRKVNKSAVVRNRIRRRVYEIIRRQEHSLPPGSDLVFTAFSDELATMNAPRLEQLVWGLVEKALNLSVSNARSSSLPHGIVKTTGK